jgi:hypothetical protein
MAKIYLLRSKIDVPSGQAAHCCICDGGVLVAEAIVECRPTGDGFTIEDWVYCHRCWNQMELLRKESPDIDRIVAELACDEGLVSGKL